MDYTAIKCPFCESQMAPIIYGYPTPEMIDLARQDMIALGGVQDGRDLPSHYCYSCNEVSGFGLSS
jgi:hypothetical protein